MNKKNINMRLISKEEARWVRIVSWADKLLDSVRVVSRALQCYEYTSTAYLQIAMWFFFVLHVFLWFIESKVSRLERFFYVLQYIVWNIITLKLDSIFCHFTAIRFLFETLSVLGFLKTGSSTRNILLLWRGIFRKPYHG